MGGSSTTVQKNDPWGPAQPFILEGLQAAQQMWNADPNRFVVAPWTGSSVAAEDPALQAARDAMGGFQYQGQPAPQLPDLPAPSPTGGGGGGGGGSLPWSPTGGPAPSPTGGGGGGGGYYVGDRRFDTAAQARQYAKNVLGIEGYTPVYTPPSGTQNKPSPTTVFGQPVSSQTAQQPSATPNAQTATLRTAGPMAATQAAAQPSGDNLVSRQIGLANQAQQGVNQIGNTAASNPMDPAFSQGIAGAQAAMRNYMPNVTGPNANFSRVGNEESNARVGGTVNQGISLGMNQNADPRFNQGLRLGMDQRADPRFNRGVANAQAGTNSSAFNRAINNMTGDGYDQRLRNQLRENVSASVMPGMNATFANSGMTGSGLHQQNLARGLSSGMADAEAEFLNRAQDRQFQAGTAAQQALMANRSLGLQAGGMAQSAAEDARRRALEGGSLSQGALEAARQRALGAGALGLSADNSTAARRVTGAQMGQQGMLDRFGQQFQVGSQQAAQEAARRAQALQAGGMAQDAGMSNREQALRAFGMNNQMQQGAYNPYLQQQAVGEARTRDRQQQIAADILAFNQAQAGPIDAINNYLSLTSGLGSEFGSSASTSRNNPGLFGILGGLGQMLPFF